MEVADSRSDTRDLQAALLTRCRGGRWISPFWAKAFSSGLIPQFEPLTARSFANPLNITILFELSIMIFKFLIKMRNWALISQNLRKLTKERWEKAGSRREVRKAGDDLQISRGKGNNPQDSGGGSKPRKDGVERLPFRKSDGLIRNFLANPQTIM